MIVLRTPDGKKVVLNRSTDECLYNAPKDINIDDTARGTDLYRHVSRKGNVYYYFYHWSMWQDESCDYQLISEEKAKDFLLKIASKPYPIGLHEDERKREATTRVQRLGKWLRQKFHEELFPNIFEEDAV